MPRRSVAAALLTFAWLVALAGPASAHTVSGMGATNWRTTLTGITPALPGLSAKVVEGGSRIELTNDGPEVLVLGYDGEPYLRIGPSGVFGNTRSPATYLNCSRTGCPVPPPPLVDPLAEPVWAPMSTGRTALWHDHRAHWMGNQLPPAVARAPDRVHVQAEWTIELRPAAAPATPVAITGRLSWIPGHSPARWLLLAAALLCAGLTLGLTRHWGALAAAVALVTVNDVYHAGAIAWSWSGNAVYRVTQLVEGNSFSIAGWLVGLIATIWLLRRRVDGLYGAAFAGASAVLFTGVVDISVLSRSQAPFAGSLALDQVTVTISLGLGLGVALGAVAGIRTARAGRPAV